MSPELKFENRVLCDASVKPLPLKPACGWTLSPITDHRITMVAAHEEKKI